MIIFHRFSSLPLVYDHNHYCDYHLKYNNKKCDRDKTILLVILKKLSLITCPIIGEKTKRNFWTMIQLRNYDFCVFMLRAISTFNAIISFFGSKNGMRGDRSTLGSTVGTGT